MHDDVTNDSNSSSLDDDDNNTNDDEDFSWGSDDFSENDSDSDDDLAPSSLLTSQLKDAGFGDLFGSTLNLQPPPSDDEDDDDDDDDDSDFGSLADTLRQDVVKPEPSPAKPPVTPSSASSSSVSSSNKSASNHSKSSSIQEEKKEDPPPPADEQSYHSEVSSIHDDDHIQDEPDPQSPYQQQQEGDDEEEEEDSESSGEYESDEDSEDDEDNNVRTGPREAPLLRLENVTAMQRNTIPEDQIVASKQKKSGWSWWGNNTANKAAPSPSVANKQPTPLTESKPAVPAAPPIVESPVNQPAPPKPSKPPVLKTAKSAPMDSTAYSSPAKPSKLTRAASSVSAQSNASSAKTPPIQPPSTMVIASLVPLSNKSPHKKSPGSVGSGASGDGLSVISGISGEGGKTKRRKKKKKSLGDHFAKVRKVGRHGDEVSVGTITKQSGPAPRQHVLYSGSTRDLFANVEDGSKSAAKPWQTGKNSHKRKQFQKSSKRRESVAFPTTFDNLFPATNFGALEEAIMEEDDDEDDDNQNLSISNSNSKKGKADDALDEIQNLQNSEHLFSGVDLPKKKLLDADSSDSDSDNVSFQDDSETDRNPTDEAANGLDELYAMSKLESKLQVETQEVNFDHMWDDVSVDPETALDYEKRKRAKNREKERKRVLKEKEKEEKAAQRLRLFQKANGDRRKRTAKLSTDFIQAIHTLFSDEEDTESSGDGGRRRREKESHHQRQALRQNSVRSIFLTNGAEDEGTVVSKHTLLTNHHGDDDDSSGDSDRSSDSDDSDSDAGTMLDELQSLRSRRSRGSKSKTKRRRRKPRQDPSKVFEEEMQRVKHSKVLSVSSLRQEMSDRRGTSINLIQKEFLTYKKKQQAQAERQQNNNDMDASNNTFELEGFGGNNNKRLNGSFRGSMVGALNRSIRNEDTGDEKGLSAHLSRWNQDDGVTQLDDLATVQHSPRTNQTTGIAAMAKDLAANVNRIPDNVMDMAQRPVYKMSNFNLPTTQAGKPVSKPVVSTQGIGSSNNVVTQTPRKSPKKKVKSGKNNKANSTDPTTPKTPSGESPAALPSLSEMHSRKNSAGFGDLHLTTINESDDDHVGLVRRDDGTVSSKNNNRKKGGGGFFGMGIKRTPKNKKGKMKLLGDERGLLS